MTADEFRDAIAKLGLKQTGQLGVDAFLSVNETTVRRWARGALPIPGAVAKLLWLMIHLRLKPETVTKIAENAPSRERKPDGLPPDRKSKSAP
jgi:hypothetical protein